MKKSTITASTALVLLMAIATAGHAGLSEDKNGVLHCSGKSSCSSLKQACENGHADYDQTSPTTGTCSVGSSSSALLLPAVQKVRATGAGASPRARQLESLAQRYKPRTPRQERVVRQYMALPAGQRGAFKAKHPDVAKSIWDYAPYAVCFYASVGGGADVVEAGDECHEKWVD